MPSIFSENSVPQVLYDFFTNNQDCSYNKFHRIKNLKQGRKDTNRLLKEFLTSTIDEVRVRKANEYAENVLFVGDMDDADYFRRSLLRREIVGDIDYNRHRDHASHTVYNYLLGWYLFDNVPKLKLQLITKIKAHLQNKPVPDDLEVIKFFGYTWLYVSLLHDIGYIFEGSINTLDTNSYNERLSKGAIVINDYFHHRFWFDINIDSLSSREVLEKIVELNQINFSNVNSIASLADVLVSIGNTDEILKYAHSSGSEGIIKDIFKDKKELPKDIFELWMVYYNCMNSSMDKRIKQLKVSFKELLYKGLNSSGTRFLDHGITSGLILLLYSTCFYRLYFSLKLIDRDIQEIIQSKKWEEKMNRQEIIDKLYEITEPKFGLSKNDAEILWKMISTITHNVPPHFKYDSRFWCTGILWATAAVSFHNVLQDPEMYPGYKSTETDYKLSILGDPLTYLGILVDIIEEWDRYHIVPETVFTGDLPVQGTDVQIIKNGDEMTIKYSNTKITKKVVDSLNKALYKWDALIRIEN